MHLSDLTSPATVLLITQCLWSCQRGTKLRHAGIIGGPGTLADLQVEHHLRRSITAMRSLPVQERMERMRVIAAPMAGTVSRLLVQAGDAVTSGQDVVILESMKMEIAVQADAGGTVKGVQVSEGEFVDEGSILLELE
jgi:acetyl-CoA carboxylase biotin carboxyl carrier protein